MGILSMNADELRYKMKHLGVLCPNRSVANDEEFHELYSKFRDVIEDTEYKYRHCRLSYCATLCHGRF